VPEFSYYFNTHVPLPKPTGARDHHGTRCTGQVAARRNDACGVGIAYDSKAEAAALNLGFGVIDDVHEHYVVIHDDEETFLRNLSDFDN